jgi:hypothetical protein
MGHEFVGRVVAVGDALEDPTRWLGLARTPGRQRQLAGPPADRGGCPRSVGGRHGQLTDSI